MSDRRTADAILVTWDDKESEPQIATFNRNWETAELVGLVIAVADAVRYRNSGIKLLVWTDAVDLDEKPGYREVYKRGLYE